MIPADDEVCAWKVGACKASLVPPKLTVLSILVWYVDTADNE